MAYIDPKTIESKRTRGRQLAFGVFMARPLSYSLFRHFLFPVSPTFFIFFNEIFKFVKKI